MLQIKVTFVLITTILIYSSRTTQILDKNIAVDFLKNKSLQFGYILGCYSIQERINFARFLMENNLRVIVDNADHYNLDAINEKLAGFHHFGVIVDGNCDNIENILKQAGDLLLFDDVHHWLIMASNNSILTNMFELNLNINSDLYVAIPNTKNYEKMQKWKLTDVYNPSYNHGGEIKINDIGFYNKKEGFQINNKGNKYWNRRNMTGVTLSTMIVLRQPFEKTLEKYLEYDTNRRKDSFTRFHYRLIQNCQELYNFSLKISMTKSWGYEYEKGKFDGLAGALQRKEVDFGSTALYVKPERLPIIDFATGLWEFREIFVFRQPQSRSFSQAFLYPVSTSTWLATLAATTLILILLKLTLTYECYITNSVKDSLDQTWSTLILFILGAFCQQGSPETPNLPGGRIITISTLTFCFLFYQFYSGIIVSFLLIKPPVTIKNPEDLLNSSLKVGSDDAPYISDFFQTTTDPVAIDLYRTKILNPDYSLNYYTPDEGLKLVAKGDFSYQVEITAGYIIIQNTFSNDFICELGEVQIFPTKRLMTVLQKNSPFRDMFNYCMLRSTEHGIGAYQKAQWGASKPDCLPSSTSISIEVNLKQIYPAIALLFIGILISLMILLIEKLRKRKDRVCRKKKIKYFN